MENDVSLKRKTLPWKPTLKRLMEDSSLTDLQDDLLADMGHLFESLETNEAPATATEWEAAICAALVLGNDGVLDFVLQVFEASPVVITTILLRFPKQLGLRLDIRQWLRVLQKTRVKRMLIVRARLVPGDLALGSGRPDVGLEFIHFFDCTIQQSARLLDLLATFDQLRTFGLNDCRVDAGLRLSGYLRQASNLEEFLFVGDTWASAYYEDSDFSAAVAAHAKLRSLQIAGFDRSGFNDLLKVLEVHKGVTSLDLMLPAFSDASQSSEIADRLLKLIGANRVVSFSVDWEGAKTDPDLFSSKETLALFKAASTSPALKRFELFCCTAAPAALACLAHHPSLKTLGVRVPAGGDSIKALTALIVSKPDISQMEIRDCNFTAHDTELVVEAIARMKNLKTLRFVGETMSAEQRCQVLDAAAKNASLKWLELEFYKISDEFVQFLENNTTLKVLEGMAPILPNRSRILQILDFNRQISGHIRSPAQLQAGLVALMRSIGLPGELASELMPTPNYANLKAALRARQVNRAAAGLPALAAPARPDSSWRRKLDALVAEVRLFELNRLVAQGVDLDALLNRNRPDDDDAHGWGELVAAALCVSNPQVLDLVLKALPLRLTSLCIHAGSARAVDDPLKLDARMLGRTIDQLKIKRLTLIGVDHSREWLEDLAFFKSAETLEALTIDVCQAGEGIYAELIRAVDKAPRLRTLRLAVGGTRGGLESLQIFRSLAKCKKIESFEFPGHLLYENCLEALEGNTTLSTLHLDGRLSLGTCKALAALVISTPTLKKLKLQNCGFDSQRLEALARGLARTAHLKVLDLSGNSLGSHREALLISALKENRSLTEIVPWTYSGQRANRDDIAGFLADKLPLPELPPSDDEQD